MDATNAPGQYKITITSAEATAETGTLAGKSSTADIVVMPKDIAFVRLPTVAPGENGGLPTVNANNRIAGIAGTKNTLDDLTDADATADAAAAAANAASVDAKLTTARAANLDNLDELISSRSDHSAADVWAVATRTLSAFTFDVSLGTDAVDADALKADAVTEIANGLLDLTDGVESGLTLRQYCREVASVLANKLSGGGTGTEITRDHADSKNRLTFTVDANGNRTAITKDLT